MIRSRWFALQATAIVLAASAVPGVQAQRCPYTAQFQLQMQIQMMPPPLMQQPRMTIPNYPAFQPPGMTRPYMPLANRPTLPTMHSPAMPGLTRPGMHFPGVTAHVPRLPTHIGGSTPPIHTVNRVTHTNTHTLTWHSHVPAHTLHFTTHSNIHTTHSNIHTTYSNIHTTHSNIHATHSNIHATHSNIHTTVSNIHAPGGGGGGRPVNNIHATHSNIHATHSNATNPNPLQNVRRPADPGIRPAAPKPGTGTPDVKVTGKFNFQCGSCHNCKQPNTPPATALTRMPMIPPSQPLLTALPRPPVVLPRLTPPMVALAPRPVLPPFMPMTLLPPPHLLFVPGTSTTVKTPFLLELATAPKLPLSLSKTLVLPPKVIAPPTESVASSPSLAMPAALVLADPNPPALPSPVLTGPSNMVRPVDLMVAAELRKSSTSGTSRLAARNTLTVQSLLQPPPLPSGALVTLPERAASPSLDDPPKLPSLVEILTQPPELPPSSSAGGGS